MSQPGLSLNLSEPHEPAGRPPTRPDEARLLRPVRNQVEMMLRDLDSLLAEDHPARAIWALLEGMNLTGFYVTIKATLDRPGRPAVDPQVLLALWVYATAEGVGSARQLERLCNESDAYRWLCGGLSMNYHTLSDFRVAQQAALDQLLSEILATLMAQKLVTLERVAQDGMRVRASAGADSFHRRKHLEQCLEMAQQQVQRLAQERDQPDPQLNKRKQQARERAARERAERIAAALRQLPAVQAAKERQERTLAKPKRARLTEPRVSTTDPEARVMKMPDGGFRPAYNVQLTTDVASGIIVGVEVVNQGNDAGQAVPMEDQLVERTGTTPEIYLMDGGYAQREAIQTLSDRGVEVYAPVRPPRTTTSGRTSNTPRADDPPAVVAWRARMETETAKKLYKLRAATAEWTNAQISHHGLPRFTVRGLTKALTVALLVAVTHNLLRWLAWAA